jgi:hypothetical protein
LVSHLRETAVPDAYSKWLEIPEHRRPPTYYQLLGVSPSELDPKAIAAAAERQLEQLRPHLLGPDGEQCRQLEQEVIHARNTLLDPVTRQRYDQLTPDAAQPWWTPDGDQVTAAPPVPVDSWWKPDTLPTDTQAEPAAESVTAVPVEGWWQGVKPEPNATPESVVAQPSPIATEALAETKPEQPPSQSKSDDWWKKPADELPVESPPPPKEPPVVPSPVAPPLPAPPAQMPVPAARPIVSEKVLTYSTPPSMGSSVRWIALGVGVIAVIGIGILIWKKPWESTEPPPIAKINPEPAGQKKDDPSIAGGPPTKVDPETINIEPRVVEGTKEIVKIDPKPKVDPKPQEPVEFISRITLRGHQGGVYGVAVSRTGKTVLSIGEDRNVLQHSPQDEAKAAHIHKLLSPGVGIALCRDDRDAVFCDGGDVIVFDMSARKITKSFENPRGGIRSLAAAGDGAFVLTGSTDGCVRWWSISAKNLAHTLDVDEKAAVTAVAIAPDAKSAAFGLSDGRLCFWDLQKRREVKRWLAHNKGSVTAVAFSPDGKRLASAGDDNLAVVWQTNGTLVKKLAGHEGAVLAVGWCSDSQRVVTGGVDKQLRLWSEANGWAADWKSPTSDKVFSLGIGPHDRFVAAGLSSGEIRLVSLPSPTSMPMKEGEQ